MKHFGDFGDTWHCDLAIDDADNLYVASETGDWLSDSIDTLLVKLSPAGEVLWQRRYGCPEGAQSLQHCCVDGLGQLYAVGTTTEHPVTGLGAVILHKYSLDGELLAEYALDGIDAVRAVEPVATGGIYLAGKHDDSLMLARLSSDGDAVWARGVGYGGGSWVNDLMVDSAGRVRAAAHVGSGDDVLLSFSPSGELLSALSVSGMRARIDCLTELPDGTLALGGRLTRNYGCFEDPLNEIYEADMPLLICLDGDDGWLTGHYLELIDELPGMFDWDMLIWGSGVGTGNLGILQQATDGALYAVGIATDFGCSWTPVDGTVTPVIPLTFDSEVTRQELSSVLIDEPVVWRDGEFEDPGDLYYRMLITRLR